MTTTIRPSTHPVFAAFSDTAKAGIDRNAGLIDSAAVDNLIGRLGDLVGLLGRYENIACGDTIIADRAIRVLVSLTNTLKEGAR